jgi:zinc protease
MIERTEVGGVPVLLAPTTGPTRAGLAFRVGFVDEPLSRRGITHLVEHLALHAAGIADHHYNGATGVEFTHFHSQGSDQEIADFLNGVCASLRDLPMHRLAIEKDLLRAEANGRSSPVAEQMALWRHGARDYGMSSYPEWGLPAIAEDDLRGWSARFFTRENAVLWVAGEAVPAGLRIDLPAGTRRPVPMPSSALPSRPAWFPGSSGVVVWDAVVPRSAAAATFADVLERMMFRELRQEAGLSYTAQTDCQVRGRDQLVITALADSLPEKQGAVLGAFVDVLATVRAGRIDPADVTATVNRRVEALRHAEEAARLPGQALNLLVGRPVEDLEQAVREARSVTVADVAAVAAAAWATGLLMAPARADWAGFAPAPTSSNPAAAAPSGGSADAAPAAGDAAAAPSGGNAAAGPVGGIGAAATVGGGFAHRSLEDPARILLVAPDRVSLGTPDELVTIRFADCVLVRAWPDGARQLVGADGLVLHYEPTLFVDGFRPPVAIDAAVRREVWVGQPARDPSRIPMPGPAAVPAPRIFRPSSEDRVLGLVGLIVCWPLTVISGLLALLMATSLLGDDEDRGSTVGLVVFFLVVAVFGVLGIWASVRRRRGHVISG